MDHLAAMQGYGHPAYAASLSEFGEPRHLQRSNGWLLERPIQGGASKDAMGCYPLFVCSEWSRLGADLEDIEKELICVSLVTDPFGEYDVAYLGECFPDVMIPFKEHFFVDLSRPLDTFVHSHHRRNARKALRALCVEKCTSPPDVLDEWTSLYGALIERHKIKGIAAFSKESFAKQLRVPGVVVFRAMDNDAVVGMLIWYVYNNRAYYHLGAYSPRGYELLASFALFDYSIRYFADQKFEWVNLGSGAGVGSDGAQGLSRFKQGWSTGTGTAYFCGRILDPEKYDTILKARHLPPTKYFPAYREGEFR